MHLRSLFLCTLGAYTGLSSVSVPETRIHKANVSWYNLPGKMANGGNYSPDKLTAAHKTLPFGTLVRFINPVTNASVVVRITDRGPFIDHRDFDLSKAAFRKVAMTAAGVATLHYHILKGHNNAIR